MVLFVVSCPPSGGKTDNTTASYSTEDSELLKPFGDGSSTPFSPITPFVTETKENTSETKKDTSETVTTDLRATISTTYPSKETK